MKVGVGESRWRWAFRRWAIRRWANRRWAKRRAPPEPDVFLRLFLLPNASAVETFLLLDSILLLFSERPRKQRWLVDDAVIRSQRP